MLHLFPVLAVLIPSAVQDRPAVPSLGHVPHQFEVRVRTAQGTRLLLAVPGRPVVVPLTGRSTAFPPADAEDGTVSLTVSAPGWASIDVVRVEILRHSAETEVRTSWPLLQPVGMGPAQLPVKATVDGRLRNLLPELARSDGNALPPGAAVLEVELPADTAERDLVLAIDAVRESGRDGPIWARPQSAAALETVMLVTPEGPAESAFRLDLVGASLDRLVLRERVDLGSLEREPGELLAVEQSHLRHTGICSMCGADMRIFFQERDSIPLTPLVAAPDESALKLNSCVETEFVLAAPEPGPAGTTATLLVTFDGVFPPADGERSGRDAESPESPEEPQFAVRTPRTTGFPVHFEGPDEQLDIRPTMGPGVALGDADGDGEVDLYLVQGGGREGSEPARNRLWRNRGEGPLETRFEDVTERANVGDTGWGMGSLFLDAEGDGDLDLYVANYGADVLYRNDGRGVFTDVSAAAGVGGALWSAGVCAADADLDGDLDLYVTSYLDYDESKMPAPEDLGRYRREDPIAMLPFAFPGQRNVFLRNDSWDTEANTPAAALRFTDVTDELHLADEAGRGMQAVFWDFDRDGDPDLYVANDVSYNVLFRNDTDRETGELRFRDVSFSTGLDDPRGGMGLAVGDTDGDGDEDLFLTNWQLEANALYTNNLLSHRSAKHRVATFRDRIVESGMGPYGIGSTSWGAELFDADNDGDLDLYVANGYTSPDYETTGICVGQPDHFFLNDGRGKFALDERAWPQDREPLPSRAVVGSDLDGDGDVDLVVTANNQRPELLENRHAAAGRGLVVRLEGRAPNTHGIGALVTLRAGDRTWTRELRAGASYLAGNPPELHFGLGHLLPDTQLQLEVRWPDGTTSLHTADSTGKRVTLARSR